MYFKKIAYFSKSLHPTVELLCLCSLKMLLGFASVRYNCRIAALLYFCSLELLLGFASVHCCRVQNCCFAVLLFFRVASLLGKGSLESLLCCASFVLLLCYASVLQICCFALPLFCSIVACVLYSVIDALSSYSIPHVFSCSVFR